jgi:hypothetical protein
VARTYRATFFCKDLDDGTIVQPSLHYQTDLSTAGEEPEAGDVASGIWAVVGQAFLNATPSRVSCDGLVVRSEEIPGSGILPAEGFHSVGLPGNLAVVEGDLPRELVAICNIHTNVGSRSARGYITLSGPYSEAYVTLKQWAGAYATAGHAFAALLDNSFSLGTIQPADVHPVVYSRTRRIKGFTPYTFRVSSASFNLRPHWRRSRGTTP